MGQIMGMGSSRRPPMISPDEATALWPVPAAPRTVESGSHQGPQSEYQMASGENVRLP